MPAGFDTENVPIAQSVGEVDRLPQNVPAVEHGVATAFPPGHITPAGHDVPVGDDDAEKHANPTWVLHCPEQTAEVSPIVPLGAPKLPAGHAKEALFGIAEPLGQ